MACINNASSGANLHFAVEPLINIDDKRQAQSCRLPLLFGWQVFVYHFHKMIMALFSKSCILKTFVNEPVVLVSCKRIRDVAIVNFSTHSRIFKVISAGTDNDSLVVILKINEDFFIFSMLLIRTMTQIGDFYSHFLYTEGTHCKK